MRTIQISTPGSNLQQSIQSNATTWGELKQELENNGIITDGMKGVVEESRVTLEQSVAELPTGDFTVHLFTAKIKSGSSDFDMVQMMADLQEKMNDAFNEVIESIENGEYGNPPVIRQSYSPNSVASIRSEIENSF